jgi:hypothetical protein
VIVHTGKVRLKALLDQFLAVRQHQGSYEQQIRAVLRKWCFRNLLLVTGSQLLFAKALAPDFELSRITEAKFSCNLLLSKRLH